MLFAATPDVFSHEVWARRAWLSRAAELPDHGSVFSAEAVDELLSRRGLRTPFLRMAKDGKVIPTSRFTGSGGTGATIADQVHDDDVLRLFADGSTIVLQGLHRTWEPVGDLAARLATELGHPVQVNAYITPPQSQGFAPHYDTHDVFVLQISGRKQWQVHEPVSPLPTATWDTVADEVAARALEKPVIAQTLQPGDCLYLPRGFIHSAKALGGTSVHLTFGIHAVTAADVVTAIVEHLKADDWRESMPVGWDPLDAAPTLDAIITELQRRLSALDRNAVATSLFDRRAAAQRPEPLSPVAQADAAASLQPTATVRLRRHLGVRATADGLVVEGGRRIDIPEADRAAVDAMLTGHPVKVDDLACDPTTVVRLLREGVLVIEARQ
jgi:hypothetical protein